MHDAQAAGVRVSEGVGTSLHPGTMTVRASSSRDNPPSAKTGVPGPTERPRRPGHCGELVPPLPEFGARQSEHLHGAALFEQAEAFIHDRRDETGGVVGSGFQLATSARK